MKKARPSVGPGPVRRGRAERLLQYPSFLRAAAAGGRGTDGTAPETTKNPARRRPRAWPEPSFRPPGRLLLPAPEEAPLPAPMAEPRRARGAGSLFAAGIVVGLLAGLLAGLGGPLVASLVPPAEHIMDGPAPSGAVAASPPLPGPPALVPAAGATPRRP